MHSLVVCIRTLVGIVNLVVCTIEIVASMHTMHRVVCILCIQYEDY
jgi:hypothetical protein